MRPWRSYRPRWIAKGGSNPNPNPNLNPNPNPSGPQGGLTLPLPLPLPLPLTKVDRKGMQQMYRVYDENRLGLHNTKAFAKSMKRVGSYPPPPSPP